MNRYNLKHRARNKWCKEPECSREALCDSDYCMPVKDLKSRDTHDKSYEIYTNIKKLVAFAENLAKRSDIKGLKSPVIE